jgi:hypothetical protein
MHLLQDLFRITVFQLIYSVACHTDISFSFTYGNAMVFLETTRIAAFAEDSTYLCKKSAQLFNVSGDSKACKNVYWKKYERGGPLKAQETTIYASGHQHTELVEEMQEMEIQ